MTRVADRAKFVELANKRVNSAIKTIRLIGNLSNKSNYDYTSQDVSKIFAALNKELKSCHERFNAGGEQGPPQFKLE